MDETTIPVLPCQALQPVIDFYAALGFDVTFQQRSPNPYAVVERGRIQLHFFAMKRYRPAESYSTCVVRVAEIDALHRTFRAGLKEAYGKVPTRGLPRIGPVSDTSHGVRQFLLTDPRGNTLRFSRPTGAEQHHRPAPEGTFARALHHAALFAESRDDPAAAAKVLDRVLHLTTGQPTPVERVRLLALRADVAHRLGDDEHAHSLAAEASAVHLTPAERTSVTDDLARLTGVSDPA
ncbi:VOC family protein [Streptomyces althioticus]|uniref:VOC family protein n=1 Tax=Streptomyces althioticus TaxID=83380 RepID=A0ABZ1YEJ1_9ACTN|nr:VOC family protein [Streptomyces althioticus]WTB97161.1 VOC family protein [Streptomyces althioticus]